MPRFWRSMKRDADGLPTVDHAERKGLGVVGPESPRPDVQVDQDGNVALDGKGMSVCRDWKRLHPMLIPIRLKDRQPDALGSNDLHCFRFGDGAFEEGPVSEGLRLANARRGHANIVPDAKMTLESFRMRVEATRSGWQVDET